MQKYVIYFNLLKPLILVTPCLKLKFILEYVLKPFLLPFSLIENCKIYNKLKSIQHSKRDRYLRYIYIDYIGRLDKIMYESNKHSGILRRYIHLAEGS